MSRFTYIPDFLGMTQDLTVFNLDNLIEDVVGLRDDTLKRLTYDELEKAVMDNPHTVILGNDDYFALFKLIAEQPQKAIGLLEKAAEYQTFADRPLLDENKEYFTKAINPSKKFFKGARQKLFKEFSDEHLHGPTLHWWITCDLLAFVKYNPSESLDFFQQCYEQMVERNKGDSFWSEPFWDKTNKEIQTVAEALRARNFSSNTPSYLRRRLTPLQIYKENTRAFINYFSNIKDEEKKVVLRALLDCDCENREVIAWLNDAYPELIKDAGLEPCQDSPSGPLDRKLAFVPKEETIEIPASIKLVHPSDYKEDLKQQAKYPDCIKLAKYLMKQEGTSLKDVAILGPHILIIPRGGDPSWRQGVYIINHYATGAIDHVCKTENHYSDEGLKSKIQRGGEIARYSQTKRYSVLEHTIISRELDKFLKDTPR